MGWRVDRIPAVVASYPPGFDFENKWFPGDPLMPGQIACMASHRLAWRAAFDRNCDVAAVFEDDALFPSDFETVFSEAYSELPEDWSIWHLHSFGPDQESTAKSLGVNLTHLVANGFGSHGYLIKRSLMERFLSEPCSESQPVDWFLTKGLTDRGLKVYGTKNKKALCFQQFTSSNIKETSVDDYYQYLKKIYYR
jgi:GR25 family glycosyltransferase involved in LPS biosynthesis